jgi:hypothetical protein
MWFSGPVPYLLKKVESKILKIKVFLIFLKFVKYNEKLISNFSLKLIVVKKK